MQHQGRFSASSKRRTRKQRLPCIVKRTGWLLMRLSKSRKAYRDQRIGRRKESTTMLLRLVRFTLDQRASSQTQVLANELISAIKQQPGCQSAVFFGGSSDGDCGMCVLW